MKIEKDRLSICSISFIEYEPAVLAIQELTIGVKQRKR